MVAQATTDATLREPEAKENAALIADTMTGVLTTAPQIGMTPSQLATWIRDGHLKTAYEIMEVLGNLRGPWGNGKATPAQLLKFTKMLSITPSTNTQAPVANQNPTPSSTAPAPVAVTVSPATNPSNPLRQQPPQIQQPSQNPPTEANRKKP